MLLSTIAELNHEVNSLAITSFAYYSDMDRRDILRALIDDRFGGSQAEFARAIKKSPAQVNQWLTGHRAVGDAGARHIELSLGLNSGYFDNPTVGNKATVQAEAPGELLESWDLLTQDQRQQFVAKIKDQADTNKAILEQLSPPEVKKRTVSVSERRLKQAPITFAERRKKNA